LSGFSDRFYSATLVYAGFLLKNGIETERAGHLLQELYGDPKFVRLTAPLESLFIRQLREDCAKPVVGQGGSAVREGCALFLEKHHAHLRYY
jgi:hypothetical protein